MNIGLGISVLGKVLSFLRSRGSVQDKAGGILGKIDKDQSGGISKAELADFKAILASETGKTAQLGMIEQFFDRIDKDSSGEISPEELNAARSLMENHLERLSSSDLWERIFQHIDENADGKISSAELQAAVQGLPAQLQGMAIHTADHNGPASILDYLSANPQQASAQTPLV